MKTFHEWVRDVKSENMMPNFGQQAIPIRQPSQQQNSAPKQVSLKDFASKVNNPDWIQLYEVFERMFGRQPNDPQVSQLGQALHQSAQTGNFRLLQPFMKYIKASPM